METEATTQEEFDKQKEVSAVEAALFKLEQELNVPMSMRYHNRKTKEPYGWVIEYNYTRKKSVLGGKAYQWTPWSGWQSRKDKVYSSREMAIRAKNSMMKSDSGFKCSYRILPIYSGEPEVLDNILDLPLKID